MLPVRSFLLLISAFLLSFSSAQLPACDSSFLDVYSVTAPNVFNVTGASLLNITTTMGVGTYFYVLPQPYPFNQMIMYVRLPANQPNATFQLTLNGQQNAKNFTNIPGGTMVILAPIQAQGTATANNTIEIAITNYDPNTAAPVCRTTNTFIVQNPALFPQQPGVAGDPLFVGLRGQKFQVHGIDGAVYNLISDAHAEVNARFAFLNGPRPCPKMPSTGKPSQTCWSHPGSYLGELGLQTSSGDQVIIVSGDASTGFDSVEINGESIKVGATVDLHHLNRNILPGFLTFNSTHELTIKISVFEIVVENIDSFLNLRYVSVSDEEWRMLKAHGLLGQTWQSKRYSGIVKEIEGEVDDYTIQSNELLGTDFLFNKFKLEQ